MLILKKNGETVGRVDEGGWLRLPDGRAVSPATAGWSDDQGYSLDVAPPSIESVRAAASLSFPQLLIGLVTDGWITESEGDAWLGGDLPADVAAFIDALPADQRFAARARASQPSIVLRTDPLLNAMATSKGKSDEDIDLFFETYAQT